METAARRDISYLTMEAQCKLHTCIKVVKKVTFQSANNFLVFAHQRKRFPGRHTIRSSTLAKCDTYPDPVPARHVLLVAENVFKINFYAQITARIFWQTLDSDSLRTATQVTLSSHCSAARSVWRRHTPHCSNGSARELA